VKEMPDYMKRSYVPFMKAVWNVQNQDKSIPHPPILVADHGNRRASSVNEYPIKQVNHVQTTDLSSCSFFFCQK
jgi:hypothetical protein